MIRFGKLKRNLLDVHISSLFVLFINTFLVLNARTIDTEPNKYFIENKQLANRYNNYLNSEIKLNENKNVFNSILLNQNKNLQSSKSFESNRTSFANEDLTVLFGSASHVWLLGKSSQSNKYNLFHSNDNGKKFTEFKLADYGLNGIDNLFINAFHPKYVIDF